MIIYLDIADDGEALRFLSAVQQHKVAGYCVLRDGQLRGKRVQITTAYRSGAQEAQLTNPILTSTTADQRALYWSRAGRPDHPFVGDPESEKWCRFCAGGSDGIQHR
jgi:hypothetical protein